MTILNVGIIGLGMAFEQLHYPAFQELPDRYRIAAICDKNSEKLQQWRERLGLSEGDIYADYKVMLKRDDLDLYDIMVPISLNYTVTADMARHLSGSGKGIICEKPVAGNLEEARAHRDLPKRYDVPVLIAENYRYNDETNMIREMVQNGEVGDIHYFIYNRFIDFNSEQHQGDKFASKEWRQKPDYAGGAVLDYAVHDLAALRHIFGPIDRLHAFGRPMEESYSPYFVVNTNIRFKNGVTGQFSFYCAGRETQAPFIGLRIFSTRGTIYLENRDCGTINIAYNDGTRREIPYAPQRGYHNELLNYYNFRVYNEALQVTPEMAYGDARTVFAILRSIREDTIVPVDVEEKKGLLSKLRS
ncbi:MAG: Gfo/Idh/MocA family oxidoreductase [Bacillota bacterium]